MATQVMPTHLFEKSTQVSESELKIPRDPFRWYSMTDLLTAIRRKGFCPININCIRVDIMEKLSSTLVMPSAPEAHMMLLLEFKCIPFQVRWG
jgi:hypothetical protein